MISSGQMSYDAGGCGIEAECDRKRVNGEGFAKEPVEISEVFYYEDVAAQ